MSLNEGAANIVPNPSLDYLFNRLKWVPSNNAHPQLASNQRSEQWECICSANSGPSVCANQRGRSRDCRVFMPLVKLSWDFQPFSPTDLRALSFSWWSLAPFNDARCVLHRAQVSFDGFLPKELFALGDALFYLSSARLLAFQCSEAFYGNTVESAHEWGPTHINNAFARIL